MRHRRYNAKKRKIQKGFRFWVAEVLIALAMAGALVFFCMQIEFVHGHTMQPTYNDGDLVLVNKIQYRISDPKRMDVIIFRVNAGETGRYAIGRIVGLPGERVQIIEGRLNINGKEISLGSGNLIKTPGEAQNEIKLNKNEYFILCDNYNSGEDSRMSSIGNVDRQMIVGKVVTTLMKNKK